MIPVSEDQQLPFHSFTFTLLENKRPRKSFRMTVVDDGLYELHVQQGSATNPSSQFTRKVPLEAAERLRDTLQSAGAFGWEASYGDETAPGSRRWSIAIVFKEGVFSVESKGGSDVPSGFDDLLEELYRMDFPRPVERRASGSASQLPTSIGDAAAFASQLGGSLPGFDPTEMRRLLAQAGSNPEALARQMKDEVRHMSPAERDQLIDLLVQTGMGTRAFWEDFFRNL